MELMDVLYKRRAVRDYTSAPIDKDTIGTLLHAAVQAPSATNSQPWAFAVIQDTKLLKELSDRCKQHLLEITDRGLTLSSYREILSKPDFNIFYNANTLIIVCGKPGAPNVAGDCHLAAQNLMLAAFDMGLATCPIGLARPWVGGDSRETDRFTLLPVEER